MKFYDFFKAMLKRIVRHCNVSYPDFYIKIDIRRPFKKNFADCLVFLKSTRIEFCAILEHFQVLNRILFNICRTILFER